MPSLVLHLLKFTDRVSPIVYGSIFERILLSGLFLGMLTLSINTYASDDSPLPDVVKTPAPTNPIPIPYPNIGKSADKPDSKAKGKRVDKNFDRRGGLRFEKGSKYLKSD